MSKKPLTITLIKSELIYDFQNKAYLTGRSRKTDATDTTAELVSNIQASDDEEDKNQALRSIQTAFAALLSEMSEGLFGVAASTATNELMSEEGDITLHLHMPSNFNLGMKDTMCSAIHDYIVNKALADWFLITDKADAAEYATLATAALASLRRTLYKRERPTRREVD